MSLPAPVMFHTPHKWRASSIRNSNGFGFAALFVCEQCGERYQGQFKQWLGECPGQPSIEQRDAQIRALVESARVGEREGL
jgi:hypothetical protein